MCIHIITFSCKFNMLSYSHPINLPNKQTKLLSSLQTQPLHLLVVVNVTLSTTRGGKD